MTSGIAPDDLQTYADVVLRCGVNIAPRQKLLVVGDVEHRDLVVALAERAYVHGASLVSVFYWDDRIYAAQAAGAPDDESARAVPPWFTQMYDTLIAEGWARIRVVGDSRDDPYQSAPMERASALQAALFEPSMRTVTAGINWCLCPFPTAGWAERVYGEPDAARLWRDLRFMLRLDEADPVAAWEIRRQELSARAAALNEARFTALRFRGGETDLTVTLHADAVWQPAWLRTPAGRTFLCNLPSEEIFTAPDFRGVHGTVAVKRPLSVNGVMVEGLVVRFEDGRISDVRAGVNEAAVRAQLDEDDGARRLGEVALVDGESRVGQVGRAFRDTLIDENATCHIAWGAAIEQSFPEPLAADDAVCAARGVNRSHIHQDAMIGGPDVTVSGVTSAGDEVPLLVEDRWRL